MTEPTPAAESAHNATAVPGTWLGGIARRLLGGWGARIGLLWVAILVLLAVFAPFIANSRPLAIQQKGQWSSPLIEHLATSDVVLLAAFFSGLILYFVPVKSASLKAWVWLGVIAMTTAAGAWLIQPSQVTQFADYRTQAANDAYDTVLWAPLRFSPTDRQHDLTGQQRTLRPASLRHPMGTTLNGADVMSRMIHGTRVALAVGLIATGISLVIGILIGALMGYFSGVVDLIGMRLVEIFSAIPTIFLLIMIVAFYKRDIYLMMTVIGLFSWVGYAAYVRAEFLKLRNIDYVQAAKAVGVALPAILFRHLLPNALTPVLVLASFGVASAILYESILSFLGLGLVEEPSWGQMLNEATEPGSHVGLLVFPGLAIFLTVLALNLIGEGLRDALDPRSTR